MTIIKVICPSCKKKGNVGISDDAIKNVSRGLLAINVTPNLICEHSFIAYLDKNLSIRDYFIADFQIEIPEIDTLKLSEAKEIISKDTLNLDAIKLNLTADLITHVLKSIFFNKKIAIITDLSFLKEHILNFFRQLIEGSFDAYISVISEEEYKSNKKNYKEQIVLDGKKILRDEEKIIQPKKLKVEKQMVSNFFMELDPTTSFFELKNEIRKTYRLSQSIVNFAAKYEKDVTIDSELIIDHLEKEFKFKIDKSYLEFLLGVVEVNFGVKNIRTIGIKDYLKYSTTTGFRPKL
ncbi:MAG: hypothetical protein ACFFDK_06535 [Promethearchaeota archaeon]